MYHTYPRVDNITGTAIIFKITFCWNLKYLRIIRGRLVFRVGMTSCVNVSERISMFSESVGTTLSAVCITPFPNEILIIFILIQSHDVPTAKRESRAWCNNFVSSTSFHVFHMLTLRVRHGLLLPSINWKLHWILLRSCFHMNYWQSTVVHTHGWNRNVDFALLTTWSDPLWDGKTS